MQLSPAREREQIMKHTNVDGTIQVSFAFIFTLLTGYILPQPKFLSAYHGVLTLDELLISTLARLGCLRVFVIRITIFSLSVEESFYTALLFAEKLAQREV